MKRIIIGLVVSSGLIYLARKMHKDGQLDVCRGHVNKFLSKSKRNLRNVAAITKNEATYLKERVEDKLFG